MNIFLYDYVNLQSEILVFGYTEKQEKCQIQLSGFDICCNLVVDQDYFNSYISLQKTLEQLTIVQQGQKGKQIKTSVKTIVRQWEYVEGTGFKGCSTNSVNKLLRVSFNTFDHYEAFKRTVNQFNEQIMQLPYLQETKDITQLAVHVYASYISTTNLKELRKAPIRMLEDDPASKYIYKLQRHFKLQVSGWNTISDIQPIRSNSKRIAFESVIQNIKPNLNLTTIPLDILSWDIEVSTESGKFDSNAYNPNNRIVCICYTVGSSMSMDKSRKQVCIISNKHNQQIISGEQGEHIQVIETENELQMIQRFADCIYNEDPTFITGFNDSSFDWVFLKQKLEYYSDPEYFCNINKYKSVQDFYEKHQRQVQYKQLLEFANRSQGVVYRDGRANKTTGYEYATSHKSLFKSSDVKVTAGNTRKGISIDIPGIICIDTRTLLMKDQVLERRSLNEYLKANNLPLKLEVSFDDMNRAFKALVDQEDEQYQDENDTLTLRESLELSGIQQAKTTLNRIYEYCVYDADACRLLWAKRNLVYQQIEICKMSFTPLRAGFLNANGIKVRNMVASFAYDQGYSVPMSTTSCDVRLRDKRLLDEYQKYPGAYVPEPHKGVSLSPVIALDFASLYPSIIMAHNLSPEKVIEEQDIISIKEKHTDLYDLVTLRNGRTVLCNRVLVDFEKDFKKANITAYVLAREEGVGIYPGILQTLFNMRAQVKKQLECIDEQIKELEHSQQDQQQIKELLFQYSLIDAKQKAIKVFMNTFYGETGNQQSSLFDVVISGGTTSYGQKYIKQVHKVIGEKDCEVVAGDTDSIYFRPRESHYKLTETTTCTDILIQANNIADNMRIHVNDMIGKQTHGFLKMAFEELLCPSVFTGKKKYFGAMYKPGDSHRDNIDVAVRGSVLVKGIDFIKSQYPELIKRHGYQLINLILNTFNNQLKQNITDNTFKDKTRAQVSLQLLDLCTDKAIEFLNDIKKLQPNQYNQLSSKKRMRDTAGGEMAGFRKRLTFDNTINQEVNPQLAISIQQLQDLNIPVPIIGEVLDIVYIKPIVFQKDLKSAEKMHLLEFAVKTNQQLDHNEYLKMFATSAIRISLAVHLPINIDELDQGSQQIHFNKAQKTLKDYFTIDRLSSNRPMRINKTIQEVHQTKDIQYIQETFQKSPCNQISINIKQQLTPIKPTIKNIKKMDELEKQYIIDYIEDLIDDVDQQQLVRTLVLGSKHFETLSLLLNSQQDSRVSYILKTIENDICEQLTDLPEQQVQNYMMLYIVKQCIQGKSATNPKTILNLFQ